MDTLLKLGQQRLVAYFASLGPLAEAEAQAIADSVVHKTFPKGATLLSAGEVCRACYFVVSGCVRQYYLVEGEERTSAFFTDGHWVISLESFVQQRPAEHFLVCAAETTLVVGDAQREAALYRAFPRFESLSRLVLQRILADEQKRTADYLTDTPEQRYLKLQKSRPELLQQVPQ